MPKKKSPSDFNDLHCLHGIDAVRLQLDSVIQEFDSNAKIATPPDAVEPDSPRPLHSARPTLNEMLARFFLTLPNSKIWDSYSSQFMRKSALKDLVGDKAFKEWMDHEDRLTDQELKFVADAAKAKAQAARYKGRGKLDDVINRYVYLNPSSTAWDLVECDIVSLPDLRYALADVFDDWLKHPDRKEIPKQKLVFDPTMSVDDTHINRFTGLTISPCANESACQPIKQLLYFLCNQDNDVFKWMVRWLAYPLQNVGAKMATAVLLHSSVHGSGKSLFFDAVMSEIYGDYAKTYGQAQLESQYNDWISETLFGVFEEVLSRNQKYSHTGTIKQMITGHKFYVEKKFLSGWTESNHMNSVFLSNEVQPLPVEPSDRRFCVVWPEQTLIDKIQLDVQDALENGGAAAFYDFLLKVPLDGFGPHTKPPMTAAKERLIDFGRASWEVFFDEWQCGELPVPFVPCRLDQLYRSYLRWCNSGKEHAVGKNRFSGFISTKVKRRRDVDYSLGSIRKKATIFFTVNCPDDQSQCEWLGSSVREFDLGLGEMSEE